MDFRFQMITAYVSMYNIGIGRLHTCGLCVIYHTHKTICSKSKSKYIQVAKYQTNLYKQHFMSILLLNVPAQVLYIIVLMSYIVRIIVCQQTIYHITSTQYLQYFEENKSVQMFNIFLLQYSNLSLWLFHMAHPLYLILIQSVVNTLHVTIWQVCSTSQ